LEIAEKSLLDKDGFHKQPQQQRRLLAQRAAAVALWSGDVGRAIHILIEHDALTADFVSFAAAAGRQAWEAVVRVYTSRLEEAGEPHLAALHLLSVGDPSAACKAYARRGMAREAALLAAAHLPPNDPQLRSLRAAYAAKLEAKGDFERAAAQYVAAHEGAKAAAALRARGSPSAVQAAAELERLLSLEVKDVGESLAAFTLAQVSPVHLDESGGMAHAAASVRKRYDPAELVAMREGPRIEMPHALQQALSTGGAASGLNPT